MKDVPEYFNEGNNCAPTTGAMLISFYDRYSKYTALYDGLLPLNHDDDKTAVDAFIDVMKTYMKTTEYGTNRNDERTGLQSYLNQHNCTGYRIDVSESFSDYVDYYNYSKNPVFVSIDQHAILGIGRASIRQYHSDGSQGIGEFMITHYDWRSRPGNYYVSATELEQFFYIHK